MRPRTGIAAFVTVLSAAGVLAAATATGASAAPAAAAGRYLKPGDLLVSESYYANDPNIVAGTTQLPPGCTTGCATAAHACLDASPAWLPLSA